MSVAKLSLDEGLTALLRGDPQLTQDPYLFYRRLRDEAPVHRLGSLVFVSAHAEAKAAYLDTERFVNTPPEAVLSEEALSLLSDTEKQMYDELLEFERGYMSRIDGATHARVRSAVRPAFTARHMAGLEGRARQLTDELLDELSRQECPDMIELAYQLPLLVVTSMLGAPPEDADLLKRWGNRMFAPRQREGVSVQPEVIQRAKRAMMEYRAYVHELIANRRSQPRNELGAALRAAIESERLTQDELVATYLLILHAGHETTTNLIGNGLLALLEHRDQWTLLCSNPSLAPGAVEEAFRYDAPVQVALRTAAVDVTLNEIDIGVGTPLCVLIGSANRDPKAFSNPDDLDINRHPNAHLSLGRGVHFCLGAPLARLQGRIVFSTLARRFPGTELAMAPNELPRTTDVSMRALMSLPVKLRA